MSAFSRWRVGVLATGSVAGALVAGSIVLLSLDPDRYFHYVDEALNPPWSHPTRAVILLSALALVETAAVTVALARRGPYLALRAGATLLLLLPLALLSTPWVIHSSDFYLLHLVWLYLLIVTASVALVAGLLLSLWRARRGPRENAATRE